MAAVNTIEITSASKVSIEDAVQNGLSKVGQLVNNITGSTVENIKTSTKSDGTIDEWLVTLKVTFLAQ